MRDLKRNQRTMYYALQTGYSADPTDILDTVATYGAPVLFKAELSDGKSESDETPFGLSLDYDRVITTVNKDLPITETTLICYGVTPEVNQDGTFKVSSANYMVASPPLVGLDGVRIAIKLIKRTETTADTTTDDGL